MGATARRAVPVLRRRLDRALDANRPQAAVVIAASLVRIRKDGTALRALRRGMQARYVRDQLRAAAAWSVVYPSDEKALKLLFRLLDKDPPTSEVLVPRKTKESIVQMARHSKVFLPGLLKAVEGREHRRRIHALRCLRFLGAEVEATVPTLKPFLRDRDPDVRAHADWAIQTIQEDVRRRRRIAVRGRGPT
jgi:hypothetical protein